MKNLHKEEVKTSDFRSLLELLEFIPKNYKYFFLYGTEHFEDGHEIYHYILEKAELTEDPFCQASFDAGCYGIVDSDEVQKIICDIWFDQGKSMNLIFN